MNYLNIFSPFGIIQKNKEKETGEPQQKTLLQEAEEVARTAAKLKSASEIARCRSSASMYEGQSWRRADLWRL